MSSPPHLPRWFYITAPPHTGLVSDGACKWRAAAAVAAAACACASPLRGDEVASSSSPLLLLAMSGKRKAAQVDGQADGAVVGDQCVQLEKQAKKHVTTSAHALSCAAVEPSPTPSSVRSLPPSSLSSPSTASASQPSSPRTAPLPDELHTPPALDDGLLALLSLSPQSSTRRREGGPSTASSLSLPSSPQCGLEASRTLGKRSRPREGDLPAAPPLAMRATAHGAEAAAAPSSAPPAPPVPPTPRSAEPSSPADVGDASASTAAAAAAVLEVELGPAAGLLLPASLRACGAAAAVSSSPSYAPSRSTLSRYALNVDSAIRQMQGISISSLSLSSLSPSVAAVLPPALSSPSPSLSAAVPAVLAASAAAVVPAPRPLPLIRLTLGEYGVRRTASNDSAQGALKKHKRSGLSPQPTHSSSPHADSHAQTPLTTPHAEPLQEGHASSSGYQQQLGAAPRPDAKGSADEASDDEGEAESLSSLPSDQSELPPRLSAGRERDEEEESASVSSSVDTALSASSGLHARSPSCSTADSCGSSSALIRCELCDKELSSALQLEGHMQGRRHQHVLLMRQRGGAFACELCGKTFTCAADQEKHRQGERHRELLALQAKAGEGRASVLVLACELCGVTFTGLTQQRQHLEGKKHTAMTRMTERGSEAKEDGGKERRKREDSKGRDSHDADGLSAAKKRKYARSSSGAAVQQPASAAASSHLQPQQQPSPTPRRILPAAGQTSTAGHTPPARVVQTIRYITPPPQLQQPTRWSSHSVGSGGSDGGQQSDASSGCTERRRAAHHSRAQYSVRSLQADDASDAASYASSPSASSHNSGSPSMWEQPGLGYAACDDSAACSASHYPAPPPPFHHAPVMFDGATHPLPSFFPSPPAAPSFLPAPLASPMFAYLSPSAAAAMAGPVVPSLTPVTVLYPTELVRQQLLLSHAFSAPHPFALPPLYILPAPHSHAAPQYATAYSDEAQAGISWQTGQEVERPAPLEEAEASLGAQPAAGQDSAASASPSASDKDGEEAAEHEKGSAT